MPTYEYRCKECNAMFVMSREVDERDEPVSCGCGWEARRVYSPPAIKFKGTGFYKTGG